MLSRYVFGLVALLLCCMLGFAKDDLEYPVSSISEKLRKNADAVVRDYKVVKRINSYEEVITQESLVITIFNKSAENLGYFKEYYNDLSSIIKAELKVYNKFGELVDKPKKKDFKDIAAYSGYALYDDQRVLYYKTLSNSFPYTVEINVIRKSKQTLFLGNWYPVPDYNVSVEASSLEVQSLDSIAYRMLTKNYPFVMDSSLVDGVNKRKWTLEDFPAIDPEPAMPNFIDLVPIVMLAPNNFQYDGYYGDLSSWKNYGSWAYGLIKDRGELENETISSLKELTALCTDNYEKVKKVYTFLQNNTRYVNVSLGIGGFQPSSAMQVDEHRYGDCKALSNYMKAMLAAVDIPSNYLIIKSGDNDHIIPNFPSQQMNHVILCVPNGSDSIWLECTSQKIPFGYIGESNHNKLALIVSENGGKLVRTPKYDQLYNTQERLLEVALDSLGNIQARSLTSYLAIQFENVERYFYMTPKEQRERIYEVIDFPRFKLEDYNFTQEQDEYPKASSLIKFSVGQYAKESSNRLFFNPNILNQSTYVPKKVKQRKYDVVLNYDFIDIDTVIVLLPSQFKVEYLPDSVKIENEFGSYEGRYVCHKDSLFYVRKYSRKQGRFEPGKYNEYREFLKKVARSDQNKIVLIRN